MRVTYLLPVLSLTGCVTLNPQLPALSPDECFMEGVEVDFGQPMLPVLSQTVTTIGRVHKACNVPPDSFMVVLGCIKRVDGGYEIHATPEALKHEYCHAAYGPNHSVTHMSREWAAERRCNGEAEFDGTRWRCN